jgi:hypothetical protein
MPTLQCKKIAASRAIQPNPLKSQDFRTARQRVFFCRATKYSLQAGVRYRRAVELKKKKLSFETAVTKSLDART